MFTCTLCLIKFENEPYAKLPYENTLEGFLISLDLASETGQEFSICKPCNRSFQLMKHLQAYLSETEMKIEAYLQYRKETNVPEEEENIVLLNVLEYLQGNFPKGVANNEHICRICLQWITLPDSAYLLKEDSDLYNILKLLWPKLNLRSLENQLICNICEDNLNDVSTFYQKCCNPRNNCEVFPVQNLRIITSTADNKIDISPSENSSDLYDANLLIDSIKEESSETRRSLLESAESELENPLQQPSETLTGPSGNHDEAMLELDISECFNFHKNELDSCAALRSRRHLRPRKKNLLSLENELICNVYEDNLNDVSTFYQKCCNLRNNCEVSPVQNLRIITSTADNKIVSKKKIQKLEDPS